MTPLPLVNCPDLQSSSATMQPEDQPGTPDHARPLWIAMVSGVFIASLVLLLVADGLFHPQRFQIQDIEVRGRFDQVDGNQVKRIVEAALEGNYFSLSLHRLENRITQIPGVFSASLRRQWPSTIVVDVVEVQPVARWGENQWLNFTGDLVDRQETISGNNDAGDYPGLPILFGPENQRQTVWETFRDWSGQFASNGLVLNQLGLDSRDLWHLNLSLSAPALHGNQSGQHSNPSAAPAGVSIVVDRDHADSRIRRFIAVLNQQQIIQLAEIQSIDLRYPNGFSIGWRKPLQNQASNR